MKAHYSPHQYLQKFGLEPEEVMVYMMLLKRGGKKVSDIIRETGKSRGHIEKVISQLEEKLLVRKDPNSGAMVTGPVERLEDLLKEKKEKLKELQGDMPDILDQLSRNAAATAPGAKVLHYSGIDGLKQVMWNSVKATGIVRLFEMAEMSRYLDYGFYEKVRQKHVENDIDYRELTNLTTIPSWTNVAEFVSRWEARYIDPRKISMKFEMILYNDVYALYHRTKSGIFCVEIYSEKLATFQKQLFDFMWKKAVRMKVLNRHGEAKVVEKQAPV